jgi:hypothetical protein
MDAIDSRILVKNVLIDCLGFSTFKDGRHFATVKCTPENEIFLESAVSPLETVFDFRVNLPRERGVVSLGKNEVMSTYIKGEFKSQSSSRTVSLLSPAFFSSAS